MNPIQLFDPETSTFTYILPAAKCNSAVLIDPVDRHLERDLLQLERLGLKLEYILETHAHADHITSAGRVRELTGALVAAPSVCGFIQADLQLQHDDILCFGHDEKIVALHTPGHTTGSMVFIWRDNAFTGDTLLINGCGRTDFQGGSSESLYESVMEKLFKLPLETKIWPSHDYKGHSVSTVAWEKLNNSRLAQKSKSEFVALMSSLDLPKPRLLEVAVPANKNLGLNTGKT
jgi:sulfur dioxygenase